MGLFATWKEVMFNPTVFYEKLPKKIKLKEPSIFFLKIQAIMLGLIYLILLMFGSFFLAATGFANPIFSMISEIGMATILTTALILFPILILFSWGMLFITSGIIHLFVLLFGGTKGFTETYKATAYATAPNILSFVPYLNWITYIYALILQVIGIHNRQKLSLVKSVAVVLIPIMITFGFALFFVFSMLFAFLQIL